MNNKIILGIAAIALSLVAVKSFTPVLAYRGDATVRGPNYTEVRHTTNVTAFEKNDYKTWVANMAGRGATRFVTESNFKEFAAAQLEAQKGNTKPLTDFRAKYNWVQGGGRGMSVNCNR